MKFWSGARFCKQYDVRLGTVGRVLPRIGELPRWTVILCIIALVQAQSSPLAAQTALPLDASELRLGVVGSAPPATQLTLDEQVAIFGPETFVRQKGTPETFARAFSLPEGVEPPFQFLVYNGGANGKYPRVSSAVISLNGVQLFGPSAFNKNTETLVADVGLSSENRLVIRIASAPGSAITISILGRRANQPPIVDAGPDRIAALPTRGLPTSFQMNLLENLNGSQSRAFDVNDLGEIVGQATTASNIWKPVVWKNGEMIEIPTLGGANGVARAISINGNITGHSEASAGGWRNYVFTGGGVSDIGPLFGSTCCTWIMGINRLGDVVGLSEFQPFLFRNGQTAILDLPAGFSTGHAHAINDEGLIAGRIIQAGFNFPAFWSHNEPHRLPSLSSSGHGSAHDVNNLGDFSGVVDDPAGGSRAAVWRNGQLIELGPFGGSHENSYSLNDVGQVLVESVRGGTKRAFLVQGQDQIELTPFLQGCPGGDDFLVLSVNNQGQIAGYCNAASDNRAFVLEPIHSATPQVTISLEGVVDDDGLPSGAGLTASWSTISGPSAVAFSDATLAQTNATFGREGTYVLRLTASDTTAQTSDDVTIVIGGQNQPPVVDAGSDVSVTLPAQAQLNASVVDDGLPAGSLTVSWTKVNGPGLVTFTAPSATSTSALFSTAGIYTLRMVAHDGILSAADDVIVLANAGENQAPVVDAGPDQTIALPASATLNGSATDDGVPPGSALTYTWSKVNGPGTVSFTSSDAAETDASFSESGEYILRLTASDGARMGFDEVTVTVTGCVPGNPLIANGSFEIGTNPNSTVPADSTNIDGWTVTPVHVDWIGSDGAGNAASHGSLFVDLNGSKTGGGVRQNVCTVPGQALTLVFDGTLNADSAQPGGQSTETMRVLIDGQVHDLIIENPRDQPGFVCNPFDCKIPWQTYSISFVPSSTSTMIEFRSLGSDNTGPELDNVRLLVDGEPRLLGINPTQAQQGESLPVTIIGHFTNFAQGATAVDFGAGISVNSVTVASARELTAQISTDPNAAIGSRTISVTTGIEVVTAPDAYTVTRSANQPPVITSVPERAPVWARTEAVGPAPRGRDVAGANPVAYDEENDRLILFSGDWAGHPPGSVPADLWVLSEASGDSGAPVWTELDPLPGPLGRSDGSLTYVPGANRLFIAGGGGRTTLSGYDFQDAWVLDNANGLSGLPTWNELPDMPAVRAAHSAVYDPGLNRLIIFGGLGCCDNESRNDVLVLTNLEGTESPTWQGLSPVGAKPPGREGHAGFYDPDNNRMVIFGGLRRVGAVRENLNDLWVLTNANGNGSSEWIALNPIGEAPRGRSGHTLVYDPIRNEGIVFGGWEFVSGASPGGRLSLNDVWVLRNANGLDGVPEWVRISPTGEEPLGRGHAMAGWQRSRNRMAMAMGRQVDPDSSSAFLNDTWALHVSAVSATPGLEFIYDVEASDPDDDPLTYFLTTAPQGMMIDANSGLVRWTATDLQRGVHPVSLRVLDDRGMVATQSFEVLVGGPTATGQPKLLSISPTSGAVGQSLQVTIVGANTTFVQGATEVDFSIDGGADPKITVESVNVTGLTALTASIRLAPDSPIGPKMNLVVRTPSDVLVLPYVFTATPGGSSPTISSISPTTGQQGQAGQLTIVGLNTNFAQGVSQLDLGAGITVSAVTVTCATCLTAQVAIADNAGTGPRTVNVTTGAEVVSLTGGFTVQPGAPFLTSLIPASGRQGQSLAVAVTGNFTNFAQGTTQVDLGAGITVDNITVASPTSLTVSLIIASSASPGTRTLTVITGAEMVSVADVFTVNAATNQPPTVSAGPDQTLSGPGATDMNGTVTDDGLPAGATLSIAWSVPGEFSLVLNDVVRSIGDQLGPGWPPLEGPTWETAFSLPFQPTSDAIVTLEDAEVQYLENRVLINGAVVDYLPLNSPDVFASFTFVVPAEILKPGTNVFRLESQRQGTNYDDVRFRKIEIAVGEVQFASPQSAQTQATFPNAGKFLLRLSADDTELTASDDAIVTVLGANRRPTVDAGTDQTVLFSGPPASLSGTVIDDGLPSGGSATITWSMVSGPGTVTFADSNAASTTVTFSQAGSYVLRLAASDSALSSYDDVTISVESAAANEPPLVNAGPDQLISFPNNAVLDFSFTDDGLPVGGQATVGWEELSGPGIVQFSDGATFFQVIASFSAPGIYTLRLTGSDGELSSIDDVVISVDGLNAAPVVSAGSDQVIDLPSTSTTLNGTAIDDGLPLGGTLAVQWSLVSGPATPAFVSATSVVTEVNFPEAGIYTLRLSANDRLLSSSDDVQVFIRGPNQAPVIDAGPDLSHELPSKLTITYSVEDDGKPAGGKLTSEWSTVSGPGAPLFSNQTLTTIEVAFNAPGAYVLRLTATDSEFTVADDVLITVTGEVPAAPTVSIISPNEGQVVTALTDIIGTVQSSALDTWRLEYKQSGEPNFVRFAEGTTTVSSAVLAQLDPTLLVNGQTQIRLRATDTTGLESITAPITMVVEGQQKVGNFTVSFNDLTIPLVGIPIQIVRTYDSRVKSTRDFGVGWTLDIRSARLGENGDLGTGWFQTSTGGIFPTYCMVETRQHIVTATLGDGSVEKFRPIVTPSCQPLVPIDVVQISFQPLSGTNFQLSFIGTTELLVAGAVPGEVDLFDPDDSSIFDPTNYRLTLLDGRILDISDVAGLTSVTDTNQNKLTITNAGIFHSSGVSVPFVRDSFGRITKIADPAGNPLQYAYDGSGDLVGFLDQEGNLTTFTYNGSHGLLAIMDPRGIQPVRNEYDENGRLIRNIDAEGNVIEYTHDLNTRQEIVTDRLGNVTVHEYDDRGNVVRTTDAEGGVTTRTYDARDNMLTETDTLNRTRKFTYDANDNRLTETDALDKVTAFTYNSRGQVLTIRDPIGRVTKNIYDAGGNLTETEDAAGNVTTFTYDARGNRTSQKDPLGHTTLFEYDSVGNLVKQTDALGHETTYVYDANNNRITETKSRTTPSGPQILVTAFEYDKLNRLTHTTFPDGSTTQVIYNSIGKQAFTIDQLGRSTEFSYDSMGRLSETVFPDGTSQSSTYDAEGRRETSADQLGRLTRFEYDKLGRLERTVFADGASASTTYDLAGQVTQTTDARGNATRFQYDAAGRRTKVIDALLHETSFEYDDAGNQVSMTDANGNTTQLIYDELNRRTRVVHPDSTEDVTDYDALGRSIAKTDQGGNTTRFRYDPLGRLTEVIDALNQSTVYGYDEVGNRTSQTDANGHTTVFENDRLGRRTRRTLPLGMSETFAYDTAGNLKTKIDFNGRKTTFTYDELNRLTQKVPDPFFAAPPVVLTYTATGQRASLSDSSGLTAYLYDERDRLVKKATPQGMLTYTYDLQGNLTSIVSSNVGGTNVVYTYDELNRLQSVIDNRSRGGTTSYVYDVAGNLKSFLYPNGASHGYSYNTLNRLTNLAVVNSGGPLASYTYTLGPAGNRTSVTELSARRVDYTYDALFRLKQEAITNDPGLNNGAIAYMYDPVGNRLNRASTVGPVPGQVLAYDPNDRSSSDTYDDNGNTAASNGRTFNYEFENRLTTMNGGEVGIVYDGDGNRVAETVNGVTTRYLVDDRNLTGFAQVLEETAGGTVPRVYTYGLDLISQSQASGTSFYGYDGHGSVRMLTDSTGAVTDRYDYDAFGNAISQVGATPNDYRYAGEQRDTALGLLYLRSRYLDFTRGRFISLDTAEGSRFDPRTLHKYGYAGGDPVNKIDPTGQAFDPISVIAATSIRSILANVQIVVGTAAIDQVLYGGDAGLKSLVISSGAIAGGAVAVRLIGGLLRRVPLLLPAGRAGGLLPGALDAAEVAQAWEVVRFRGGVFRGVPVRNFPGIDGTLDDVIHVSLKGYSGSSPQGVLTKALEANGQILRAEQILGTEFGGVELFIEARNIDPGELLRFAQNGPLSQIPSVGFISSINVNTSGGWVRFVGPGGL